jgi:peptide/nickel transport system permease protein
VSAFRSEIHEPTSRPRLRRPLKRATAYWHRHGLVRLLVRRLLATVVLGFGITLVTFVLTHLVPGDPIAANLGIRAQADPAIVRAYRAQYGLDKSLVVQYGIYLAHLLHGDLGLSQTSHRSVTTDLVQFIPASLELGITAMVIATLVGVPLGLLAAAHRGTRLDSLLRLIFLGGISTPPFWIGLMALYLFSFVLHVTPSSGQLSAGMPAPPHVTGMVVVDAALAGDFGTFVDALHHLILPAAVLAASTVGLLQRFTRSAVLDVLHNDYVTAAKAKGLPRFTVLVRYTLRAALPPIVTLAGIVFANLVTGAVLIETVFAWPGVGQYAARSAVNLDLAAITGVSLFVAFIYIISNLIVDILHAVIDPRARPA